MFRMLRLVRCLIQHVPWLTDTIGSLAAREQAFQDNVGISCVPMMQAVTFLVIHQKHKKSLEEITNDLCPVLSVQQLYRIR